jgi:hypothetical protein
LLRYWVGSYYSQSRIEVTQPGANIGQCSCSARIAIGFSVGQPKLSLQQGALAINALKVSL